MDYIRLRQRKLGVLRWVAAALRPDIGARFVPIASRINALCGSNVYRITELVRVAKDWRQATALKNASPYIPRRELGRSA